MDSGGSKNRRCTARMARSTHRGAPPLGPGFLVKAGYMELVKAGKVPQPSAEGLDIFAGNAVRVAFWAALGVVVVCAAIAPVLFAIRSEDGLTIIVSIVLVVVTWSAVIFSGTVIDLAVASVVYLASMVLFVAVFGVNRIVAAIKGERGQR